MSNRYDRGYRADDPSRREHREDAWDYRRDEDEHPPYGERHDPRNVGRFGESARHLAGDPWGHEQDRDYRSGRGQGSPYYGRGGERGRDEYAHGSYRDTPYFDDPSRSIERPYGGYDERPRSARGVYQEQVWSRDPNNGNLYGYEFSTRLPYADREPNHGRYDRSRSFWGNEEHNAGSRSVGPLGRRAGNYGKGPKGYTRSDERIREDVSDRLSDDDEIDASDITVTVSRGEVKLEGSVEDRYSKHRAEDIAESVSGVRDVANHLRARKGLLRELGDKLSGDDENAHRGHTGSGTRNSPGGGVMANH
jgi:hypothetical protein